MAKPKPDPAVAERLKQARKTLFRSAAEAAVALDVNPVTLRTHEAGSRAPSFADLQRYARRYGVALDWLISGKGDAADPRQADALPGDAYEIMGVLRDGAWLPDTDDTNVWPGWGPMSTPAGAPEITHFSEPRYPADLISAMRVSSDLSDSPYPDGSVVFFIPAWEVGYRPGDHVIIVREKAGFAEWTIRKVAKDQSGGIAYEAITSRDPPLKYSQDDDGVWTHVQGVVVGAIIRRPVPSLSIERRGEVEAQRRLGHRRYIMY